MSNPFERDLPHLDAAKSTGRGLLKGEVATTGNALDDYLKKRGLEPNRFMSRTARERARKQREESK